MDGLYVPCWEVLLVLWDLWCECLLELLMLPLALVQFFPCYNYTCITVKLWSMDELSCFWSYWYLINIYSFEFPPSISSWSLRYLEESLGFYIHWTLPLHFSYTNSHLWNMLHNCRGFMPLPWCHFSRSN